MYFLGGPNQILLYYCEELTLILFLRTTLVVLKRVSKNMLAVVLYLHLPSRDPQGCD
jgi:hypothetical protein